MHRRRTTTGGENCRFVPLCVGLPSDEPNVVAAISHQHLCSPPLLLAYQVLPHFPSLFRLRSGWGDDVGGRLVRGLGLHCHFRSGRSGRFPRNLRLSRRYPIRYSCFILRHSCFVLRRFGSRSPRNCRCSGEGSLSGIETRGVHADTIPTSEQQPRVSALTYPSNLVLIGEAKTTRSVTSVHGTWVVSFCLWVTRS